MSINTQAEYSSVVELYKAIQTSDPQLVREKWKALPGNLRHYISTLVPLAPWSYAAGEIADSLATLRNVVQDVVLIYFNQGENLQTILEDWIAKGPDEGRLESSKKIMQFARDPTQTQLDLSRYGLSTLPDIFSMPVFRDRLQELNLSRNCLMAIPLEITFLRNLQSLDLSDNNLTTLPEEVRNLQKLTKLNVSYNTLKKADQVCHFVQLEELDLGHNRLKSVPKSIGLLSCLKKLNLSHNHLSELPTEFGKLCHLSTLNLSRNKFELLPREIYSLKELNYLDLSFNRLESLAPFFCLPKLQNLNVSHNRLLSIPYLLCALRELTHLDISHNALTHLCPEINDLHKLTFLNLAANSFKALPEPILERPYEIKKLDCLDFASEAPVAETRDFKPRQILSSYENLQAFFHESKDIERVLAYKNCPISVSEKKDASNCTLILEDGSDLLVNQILEDASEVHHVPLTSGHIQLLYRTKNDPNSAGTVVQQSKALMPEEIPDPKVRKKTFLQNIVDFDHRLGICRGICFWFDYLYLATQDQFSDPEEHMAALAQLFAEGGGMEPTLLHSLNIKKGSFLGLKIGAQAYDSNTINSQPSLEELFLEWDGLLKNSIVHRLKKLAPGIHHIVICNIHAASYVKINENLAFFLDPNHGIFKIQGPMQAEILHGVLQVLGTSKFNYLKKPNAEIHFSNITSTKISVYPVTRRAKK